MPKLYHPAFPEVSIHVSEDDVDRSLAAGWTRDTVQEHFEEPPVEFGVWLPEDDDE